uniref:KH domain-containing protein n=1 Tax=Parastrongyloides trichosuri TaxID=131310 RepID=A0A0N4ZPQ7_PARTI
MENIEIINLRVDKQQDESFSSFLTPKEKVPSIYDVNNGIEKANSTRNVTLDYLISLLREKRNLTLFPEVFSLVIHLLDEEIARVRMSLFQCDFSNVSLKLPEPIGNVILAQTKVYIPVDKHPEYNFVGRILGPRGMTAKQLEQETGCKIMVRGKGSLRDKKKEKMLYGKANWEHLNDELHVLIQCEDTKNRAEVKINNAITQVNKLLRPAPEGSDELKRKQLMELAIINGTYRSSTSTKYPVSTPKFVTIEKSSSVRNLTTRDMSSSTFPTSPLHQNININNLLPLSPGYLDKKSFLTPPPSAPADLSVVNFESLFQEMDLNSMEKLLNVGGDSSSYLTTGNIFNFPTSPFPSTFDIIPEMNFKTPSKKILNERFIDTIGNQEILSTHSIPSHQPFTA